MHPTVMATLATQRQAELLRTAALRRRSRLARAALPTRRAQLGATAGQVLRERRQRLGALVLGPAPEACCA